MGMFEAFREKGWNTYYEPQRHAARIDVTQVLIACFTIIIGTSLLIHAISSRGKERWGSLLRLTFNLHTGVVILLCLTGQDWGVSGVRTLCDYSTNLGFRIQADVGLHVGLKSINVTLIAEKNDSIPLGEIYYNERFSLVAPNDMQSAAHAGRHKGLPYVMLLIVEYFEEDSGGIRWGRIFRLAGHFVYIVLWTAVVAWIMSQILTSFNIIRGVILNAISGVFMISACVLYHILQPPVPLIIPFTDGFMQLHYGWCYWLCLASGLATVLYSVVVLILHHFIPACTSVVLLSDAAQDDCEESYVQTNIPLEIMTPRQERRRQSLYQNFFTNEAFIEEKSDDDYYQQKSTPPVGKGMLRRSSSVSIIEDITRNVSNEPDNWKPWDTTPTVCKDQRRKSSSVSFAEDITSKDNDLSQDGVEQDKPWDTTSAVCKDQRRKSSSVSFAEDITGKDNDLSQDGAEQDKPWDTTPAVCKGKQRKSSSLSFAEDITSKYNDLSQDGVEEDKPWDTTPAVCKYRQMKSGLVNVAEDINDKDLSHNSTTNVCIVINESDTTPPVCIDKCRKSSSVTFAEDITIEDKDLSQSDTNNVCIVLDELDKPWEIPPDYSSDEESHETSTITQPVEVKLTLDHEITQDQNISLA